MIPILIVTLALQITFQIQKTQKIHTHVSHQNILASTHEENMHIETLLVIQIYSTMTLTIKTLTFRDKYTALLQQELQNPYWNLHDPIMTKSYQISKDMDIEMMPHVQGVQNWFFL